MNGRRRKISRPGLEALFRRVWERVDPALALVRYDAAFAAWQIERRDRWRRELSELKEKLRNAKP